MILMKPFCHYVENCCAYHTNKLEYSFISQVLEAYGARKRPVSTESQRLRWVKKHRHWAEEKKCYGQNTCEM